MPFQTGECDVANYSSNEDGTIRVYNSEQRFDKNAKSGESPFLPRTYAEGVGRLKNTTSDEGRLQVRFSSFSPWGDYQVVKTDYENFSIIYSCTNAVFDVIKFDLAWVLTRKPLDHNDPNDAAEIQSIVSIAKSELE